jgi:hypothetical protein
VPSFLESAPTVMNDQEAMDSFVAGLEASSDLMALANACSVMTCLALDEHLQRKGKDNHAAVFLDVARYLEERTAQLEAIWRDIEGTGPQC